MTVPGSYQGVVKSTAGQTELKAQPGCSRAAGAGKPQLALITCGGDLNSAAHAYYDNSVVLADLCAPGYGVKR